jgi:predicted enzyme related to lactoylglutathione lyase
MQPKAGPWPGKMAFYIDVDDIDAFGCKIVSGGGRMVVEKTDVPGVGQMALFEDPEGRVLGLWKQAS